MQQQLIALLILIGVWMFVAAELVFFVVWFRKNKFIIQISELRNGAYVLRSKRYRVVNDKFYSLLDVWKKKPLKDVSYEQVKHHVLINEGQPIIGVKYIIKFSEVDGKLISWQPDFVNDTKPLIKNILMGWVDVTRAELYERTKPDLSKSEMLTKILLPMGLILLAICCLIFFPKIYESIIQHGNAVAESAVGRFTDTMDKIKPLG